MGAVPIPLNRGGCVVTPLSLMIRYLNGDPELSSDEKEILLFALYMENKLQSYGIANRALKELNATS